MFLLVWIGLWLVIALLLGLGLGHAWGWRDAMKSVNAGAVEFDERSSESLRALERIHVTRPIRT